MCKLCCFCSLISCFLLLLFTVLPIGVIKNADDDDDDKYIRPVAFY